MKTARRNEALKWGLIAAGVLGVWVPVASRAINTTTPTAAATAQETAGVQNAPAAGLSPGVADILKMVDAKVDPEVIKTYINNASTAYNPSAAEIIALKERGVGAEILTAMLQHGAEVRAQSMRAAQAAGNPAAPGAANPYAPAYNNSPQPGYSPDSYTYPSASYVYPNYAYDYPGYYNGGYNYGYSWPWYWPSLYFGWYPYGGYCGYPYHYGGYHYPYWRGGYGYGYYHGGRGYYGGHAYYGGHGFNGSGAHPVPYAGRSAGFNSFGGGGVRVGGAVSGHGVSFGGHGGGFGGHSMGRSR